MPERLHSKWQKIKEINDELLQKWIKTYLNREVVGG